MNTVQISLFEKAKNLPRQSVNVAAFRGESQVLRILSLLLALAIAGYLYFVGVSIMNVIMSREASLESERLQSSVAELEQEYFALSKDVSIEAGASHGLVAPAQSSYVRRDTGYAANITGSDI